MTITLFFLFLAACGPAAATGAMFSPGDWYRSLPKPRWTPPDWLFPVAWTVLYLCMALAGARIAGVAIGGHALAGVGLALWALQMGLNTVWTPVFFGLRRIGGGLVVLGLLWLAVAACVAVFWRIDPIAGALFVPYLAWVSVAGALNLSIWQAVRAVPA